MKTAFNHHKKHLVLYYRDLLKTRASFQNTVSYSHCVRFHTSTRKEIKIQINPIKNIYLREFGESDSSILFSTIEANRKYLRRWLSWVDATKKESDSLCFIRDSISQNRFEESLVLSLWQHQNLLGTISLVAINKEERQAELGYWIVEKCQGQGLITQGASKLIDYSFTMLPIENIIARYVDKNEKSAMVLKRLNFSINKSVQEEQWENGEFKMVSVMQGSLPRKLWERLKDNSVNISRNLKGNKNI